VRGWGGKGGGGGKRGEMTQTLYAHTNKIKKKENKQTKKAWFTSISVEETITR
jgi:hypothetical protein